MSGESFIYKGYEVIRNYQGNWTIFKEGEHMSETSRPTEADAKRWIDKQLKKEN